MSIQSFAFFVFLVFSIAACQLRIDDQQRTLGYPEDSVTTSPSIVNESLPPMSEIRRGYYAMLVTGRSSSFIRGLYRGEATFANTSTPIINGSGVRGNIKKEFSFLYSQGLIRKLKIYFAGEPSGEQIYPLLPYESFRTSVPEDSVAATYIIASNYLFDSNQGSVELHSVSENQIQGTLNGNFISDRGDSIQVSLNFKAIRE
mgnify:CR=1 FL=1|jgi:hypothetical protein